jgi:hypothetical protein
MLHRAEVEREKSRLKRREMQVAESWRLIGASVICFLRDTMISNRRGWRLNLGWFAVM